MAWVFFSGANGLETGAESRLMLQDGYFYYEQSGSAAMLVGCWSLFYTETYKNL